MQVILTYEYACIWGKPTYLRVSYGARGGGNCMIYSINKFNQKYSTLYLRSEVLKVVNLKQGVL